MELQSFLNLFPSHKFHFWRNIIVNYLGDDKVVYGILFYSEKKYQEYELKKVNECEGYYKKV